MSRQHVITLSEETKSPFAAPSWQRESRAALGLLSRAHGGQQEYLFRYNRKWTSWNLIGGHFEPEKDRNFTDTMVREFIEESGEEIREAPPVFGRDFTVERLTPAPLVDVFFSGSAQQWTRYELHVFRLTLHGDPAVWDARWHRHPELFRWFTRTELDTGVAIDQQATISPFPLRLIRSLL